MEAARVDAMRAEQKKEWQEMQRARAKAAMAAKANEGARSEMA